MKDWKKVKLGTLLTESKVVSEKPSTDKRLRVKLNVLGVEKRPITKDKKGATKYYTRKVGQFVYGKQNLHKGAFGVVPEELDGFESSLDIPAFDIDESCYPEWIFYFFKKGDFYLKLETLAKGVGSKRIHPKQIYDLDIFLPSKEEQKKVLEEIEKAEANNQELVNEILSQEENLTKLRQSILQDAVQGKLTNEWRAQNPTVEPASELLKKIKVEKEKFIKEKKIKKVKPLPPITKDEIPFEIPESWEWCRLGEVLDVLTDYHANGAYKVLKKNVEMLDSEDYAIMLRTTNFNLNKEINYKYITEKAYNFLAKSKVFPFDIIMNKIGDPGKVFWVEETGKPMSLAMNLFLIRSKLGVDHNRVLYYYFKASYDYLYSFTAGTSVKTITKNAIKELLFPLCPKEEISVVKDKIDSMLLNINVLKSEIVSNKINAEKLMQSVLRELLGEENNVLVNKPETNKEIKKPSREIKYNSTTLLMDLVKLLKENGKLHAEDLWKMSKYPGDIDAFYAELKNQIEVEKAIKEVVNEKGYLELA